MREALLSDAQTLTVTLILQADVAGIKTMCGEAEVGGCRNVLT